MHQMGDGFAIVSDFGEATLERPIAISIALMRHVGSTGMFATAAIAEGEFADITGISSSKTGAATHTPSTPAVATGNVA